MNRLIPTCTSVDLVRDLFVTQRTLPDLSTARTAHALVLTGLQRDVRLGGPTHSAGKPDPSQGLFQTALTLSVLGGGGH